MSEYSPVLPEVLTETQQRFVDFIESKAKPDPTDKTRGASDMKKAQFSIANVAQLVPVDELEIESFTYTELPELHDAPFPVPYRQFGAHVNVSLIYGARFSIYFDAVEGFQLASETGEMEYVKDQAVEPIVNALVQHDEAGHLIEQ
jgi:hypothetical protein